MVVVTSGESPECRCVRSVMMCDAKPLDEATAIQQEQIDDIFGESPDNSDSADGTGSDGD